MKHARDLSGDPPVVTVEDTAPFASLVIATLRAWEGGGAGAALVVLRARMTEAQAGAAMAALCDLAGLLCAARRRPSAATGAHGLGADAAVFARLVEEAALGEREIAMMLASALVEGPALMELTDAASRFGLHVHRATLRDARDLTGAQALGATRH